MKRALALLALCLPAAAPANKGSLFDSLPSGAQLIIGMSRAGTAKDLAAALRSFPLARLGVRIPDCAISAYATIESVVIAVDFVKQSPRTFYALRGAGLRAAAESCLKTVAAVVTISEQSGATHYTVDGESLYVLWLDGGTTALAGPIHDARATAALARVAAPLSGDAVTKKLLAEVDVAGQLWFAIDPTSLSASWPPDLPRASTAWGQLGDDSRVTAVFASEADARAAADKLRELVTVAPRKATDAAAFVTVTTHGERLVISAPLAEIISSLSGGQKILPPTMSAPALGMVSAIALLVYRQNTRKVITVEAVQNLSRMCESARSYQTKSHKLPPDAPLTPPLGSCCKGPGERCAPEAGLWTSAAWKALQFSMDDPHSFVYSFTPDGKGSFKAAAYGDLDCDGEYSTFELNGSCDAMFRDHELE